MGGQQRKGEQRNMGASLTKNDSRVARQVFDARASHVTAKATRTVDPCEWPAALHFWRNGTSTLPLRTNRVRGLLILLTIQRH